VKWVSVKVVLLAALLVLASSLISCNQSSAEHPTSSVPYVGAPRFLPSPWSSKEVRASLVQWLDNSRECLLALPAASCSRVSLETVVRLARLSFVPVPPAPDPFESCQSLIRSLEKHGFSVTLEPRCCSAVTSPQPKR